MQVRTAILSHPIQIGGVLLLLSAIAVATSFRVSPHASSMNSHLLSLDEMAAIIADSPQYGNTIKCTQGTQLGLGSCQYCNVKDNTWVQCCNCSCHPSYTCTYTGGAVCAGCNWYVGNWSSVGVCLICNSCNWMIAGACPYNNGVANSCHCP
jgi:hypothetical protein